MDFREYRGQAIRGALALDNLYIPGGWFCSRCGFVNQKMVMDAATGAVGMSREFHDAAAECCPNCQGRPLERMVRVTPGEALMSFVAFLTQLEKPIMVGSTIDVYAIMHALDAFMIVQHIDDPRDGLWPHNMVTMPAMSADGASVTRLRTKTEPKRGPAYICAGCGTPEGMPHGVACPAVQRQKEDGRAEGFFDQ